VKTEIITTTREWLVGDNLKITSVFGSMKFTMSRESGNEIGDQITLTKEEFDALSQLWGANTSYSHRTHIQNPKITNS